MKDGLVSIIMPAYNSEKYIGETIESVLAQTYQNWELLIVDDCSTDNTPNIVRSYLAKDSRVKYYRLSQNLGAAAARNKAMYEATVNIWRSWILMIYGIKKNYRSKRIL